jgi:hypothetical protein
VLPSSVPAQGNAKINIVVALAMAALGAVRGGQIHNAWKEYIEADLDVGDH